MKKYSTIALAAYQAEDQNYSDGLWSALRDSIGAELQQAYRYWAQVKVTGNANARPHYEGSRPLAAAWLRAYNETIPDLQDDYFEEAAQAVLQAAGGDRDAIAVFFGCMYAEFEGPGAALDFIVRS